MKQQSLEASGFEVYRQENRKEVFLGEMDRIIPWKELSEAIRPYYPDVPKGAGRRPIGFGAYVANPFSTALVRAVRSRSRRSPL